MMSKAKKFENCWKANLCSEPTIKARMLMQHYRVYSCTCLLITLILLWSGPKECRQQYNVQGHKPLFTHP